MKPESWLGKIMLGDLVGHRKDSRFSFFLLVR